MTTVVDPSGTPAPVYNRSGTTLDDINAAGLVRTGATAIQAMSAHSVVVARTWVEPGGGGPGIDIRHRAIVLPSGADIGDVVEVYPGTRNGFPSTNQPLLVFPPSGDEINELGVNNPASVESHTVIRKVGAAAWRA